MDFDRSNSEDIYRICRIRGGNCEKLYQLNEMKLYIVSRYKKKKNSKKVVSICRKKSFGYDCLLFFKEFKWGFYNRPYLAYH